MSCSESIEQARVRSWQNHCTVPIFGLILASSVFSVVGLVVLVVASRFTMGNLVVFVCAALASCIVSLFAVVLSGYVLDFYFPGQSDHMWSGYAIFFGAPVVGSWVGYRAVQWRMDRAKKAGTGLESIPGATPDNRRTL